MSRPPKGIYVADDGSLVEGLAYRKPTDPNGTTWVTLSLTNPDYTEAEITQQRALLESPGFEEADHVFNGHLVVRRNQANIQARHRAEAIIADDHYANRERFKAFIGSLVSAINKRLPDNQKITHQEILGGYRERLGR